MKNVLFQSCVTEFYWSTLLSNGAARWLMAPCQTNALQVSSGAIHGTLTTNYFTDIFIVTINTVARFPHQLHRHRAATNKSSHF